MFLAELAPGAVGAKHYHPGTEFFYVLEGAFAHEPEGGHAHTMKVGEAASNPYKSVHTVKNPSTTELLAEREKVHGQATAVAIERVASVISGTEKVGKINMLTAQAMAI